MGREIAGMETTRRRLAAMAILAGVYFISGKLGLTLAFVHPSATPVWPPAGIALAALLLFGYELWPAIFVGAFLVNITTAGSLPVCLGIAAGNTLEALVGAWLVNRYARGRNAVYSTPDIFKFALLGGLVSTCIAATLGVSSLVLGGFASWAEYTAIWTTWWLGDAAGTVLVAPLLILWISRPKLRWRQKQYLEAAALVVSMVVVGLVVFDGVFNIAGKNYPIEYLCMPFLLWVAYRFGRREAASATVILSATAIWGTLHGYGPFGRASHNESLLLLQTFLSVVGVSTLGLAAAFAERRLAEEQSHFLAVSDPLTGLGNYRKLIDTLDMEIRRSSRTGRAFALLLMDMDDLKRINDTFGHVVGSRALCRLAQALRINSRNIDTAARFGGDEFALIVPELGPDVVRELWEDDAHGGRKPNAEGGSRSARSHEGTGQGGDHGDGGGVPTTRRSATHAENVFAGRETFEEFRNEATARVVQHIAGRIATHVANDSEFPKLSVSIGAAQFPADGENIEQLINAADQALYRNKRANKLRALVPPSAPAIGLAPYGAGSSGAASSGGASGGAPQTPSRSAERRYAELGSAAAASSAPAGKAPSAPPESTTKVSTTTKASTETKASSSTEPANPCDSIVQASSDPDGAPEPHETAAGASPRRR
jgi:integral membrane sensor domain MASE1/GGDEF domain-containing protein